MAYYRTMYEIRLTMPDGRMYLVAYTARKTRSGLIDAVRKRWDILNDITDVKEWQIEKKAADGLKSDQGHTIRFSGRTQREAEGHNPLTYIGSIETLGGKF